MSEKLRKAAQRLLDEVHVPETGGGGAATGRRVVTAEHCRTAVTLAEAYLKQWRLRPRRDWTVGDGWVLWWVVSSEPEVPPQPECIGPETGVLPYYQWWSPILKPDAEDFA